MKKVELIEGESYAAYRGKSPASAFGVSRVVVLPDQDTLWTENSDAQWSSKPLPKITVYDPLKEIEVEATDYTKVVPETFDRTYYEKAGARHVRVLRITTTHWGDELRVMLMNVAQVKMPWAEYEVARAAVETAMSERIAREKASRSEADAKTERLQEEVGERALVKVSPRPDTDEVTLTGTYSSIATLIGLLDEDV